MSPTGERQYARNDGKKKSREKGEKKRPLECKGEGALQVKARNVTKIRKVSPQGEKSLGKMNYSY